MAGCVGGFGIKDLVSWNTAAMMKHLWDIARKKDNSLGQMMSCICWRKVVYGGSKNPTGGSWTWQKLLKLRDKAQQLVQWQIGTGEHVYFWYDNWHPKGPLLKAYGAGILRYSCLKDMVKVSKIITERHWDWPNRLFHDLQERRNIAELETRPSDERQNQMEFISNRYGYN